MPKPTKPTTPKKPSKDSPLTAHAKNRWCQKISQKRYYLGTGDDPVATLQEYLSIKDSLQAGIAPSAHDNRRYNHGG